MKILLAESEPGTGNDLQVGLTSYGDSVRAVRDGNEALQEFYLDKPDLVILDITLSGMGGYAIAQKIRALDQLTPILLLANNDQEIDREWGYVLNISDYIRKPLTLHEVIVRLKTISQNLSRNPVNHQYHFNFGDLAVYPFERCAFRHQLRINLTLREVKILQLLQQNKNNVVSRQQFFRYAWDNQQKANSRTLDQHIAKLRKLIASDSGQSLIQTIYGIGYQYNEEE